MYPGGIVIKSQPTLSTDAYGAADLLFTKQELVGAVPSRGGISLLRNIFLHADVSGDYEIFVLFFNNSTDLKDSGGDVVAANEALTEITDEHFQAAGFIGAVGLDKGENSISIGNGIVYASPSGHAAASHEGLPMVLQGGEGSQSVWYVAGTYGGTPTYAADSLTFSFNIQYLG